MIVNFSSRLYFFPYSHISSYLLRLFLYLISILMFPCASVWENTRAVPHFLQSYWTAPSFPRNDLLCRSVACQKRLYIFKKSKNSIFSASCAKKSSRNISKLPPLERRCLKLKKWSWVFLALTCRRVACQRQATQNNRESCRGYRVAYWCIT